MLSIHMKPGTLSAGNRLRKIPMFRAHNRAENGVFMDSPRHLAPTLGLRAGPEAFLYRKPSPTRLEQKMVPTKRFCAVTTALLVSAALATLAINSTAKGAKPGGSGTTAKYALTNLGGFTAFRTFLDTQALGITNPGALGVVNVAGYSRVAGDGSTMPWDAYVWSVSQTGTHLATSDLGTLSPLDDPYANSTYGRGINNAGVVVGIIEFKAAFVDFPGKGVGTGMNPLPLSDIAGAHSYVAAAVNDPDGEGSFSIVGNVVDANRILHGLLWQVNGPDLSGNHAISAPIDLGAFVPQAINDSGVMVGQLAGFPAMATLDGGVTLLSVLAGDKAGSARGINNLGDVVGWSQPISGAKQAIVWSHTTGWNPVALKRLGNNLSCDAYDINEQGQIVGWSSTTSVLSAGVLWESGSVFDLNTLAGVGTQKNTPRVTWATGINDIGQISGVMNASATSNDSRAVVLTRKP